MNRPNVEGVRSDAEILLKCQIPECEGPGGVNTVCSFCMIRWGISLLVDYIHHLEKRRSPKDERWK